MPTPLESTLDDHESSTVVELSEYDPELNANPAPPQRAGEAYTPDWHVVREYEERYAIDSLSRPGSPVAVSAPLHFGKSWFIHRVVEQLDALDNDVQTVLVDLDTVNTQSLDALLSSMLQQIARAVGVDEERVGELWPSFGTPQHRFLTALELHIRPQVRSALVLAFDLPDRMWEFERRDDLFGIMRAISGQADPDRWRWIRVMLAFSMSTALYIEDTARSPWNVPEVQLDEFSLSQIEQLARWYGLGWGSAQVAELHAGVGGHPYLVRAVMSDALRGDGSVAAGLAGDGVHAHLSRVEALLARDEGLCASFVDAVHGRKISIGHRRRLEAAGLLRWDRETRQYSLRFSIYADMVARLS